MGGKLLIEDESGLYTEGTWEGPRVPLPFDLLSFPLLPEFVLFCISNVCEICEIFFEYCRV